jgi:hypothetical protein
LKGKEEGDNENHHDKTSFVGNLDVFKAELFDPAKHSLVHYRIKSYHALLKTIKISFECGTLHKFYHLQITNTIFCYNLNTVYPFISVATPLIILIIYKALLVLKVCFLPGKSDSNSSTG